MNWLFNSLPKSVTEKPSSEDTQETFNQDTVYVNSSLNLTRYNSFSVLSKRLRDAKQLCPSKRLRDAKQLCPNL